MELKPVYCQCGCGEITPIASRNEYRRGHIKGQHVKIIAGHNFRGKLNVNFKDYRRILNGYVVIKMPEHPRANKNGFVREHIIIAEKALGKYLPKGAVVHHINQIKTDNRNENLLICENDSYHQSLHRRLRAYLETGNADTRLCYFCGKYDELENMKIVPLNQGGASKAYHKTCKNKYDNERYAKNKK